MDGDPKAPPATPLLVGQAMQVQASLERVYFGLGWHGPVDVDASCIMYAGGQPVDAVSFRKLRNLETKDASIVHTGDVLTAPGKMEGDLERIYVWLNKVPKEVDTMVLVANVYTAGFDFSALADAYVRVTNADTNQELGRLSLSAGCSSLGAGMNAMIFAKLYKFNNAWQVMAIGQPMALQGQADWRSFVPTIQASGVAIPFGAAMANMKPVPMPMPGTQQMVSGC